MKRSENKSGRLFAVVMGIVWGLLIVIFAVSMYNLYNYRGYSYFPKPDTIIDNVLTGRYDAIYSRMDTVIEYYNGDDDHPEYSEVMAIRDYMIAAAHYRMYKENGLADEAAAQKAAMDEALANFGDLSFAAGDINAQLGVIPE